MEDEPTPSGRLAAPTLLVGLLVVVAVSPVQIAGIVAAVGTALAISGTVRGSRLVLAVGVTVQFASILVAALAALEVGPLLVAALGVVLSWDLGEQAVTTAEQVRPQATITRSFGVHAAGSVLVGIVLVGVVYVGHLLAAGSQPLVALALLLAGGSVVLWGVRV